MKFPKYKYLDSDIETYRYRFVDTDVHIYVYIFTDIDLSIYRYGYGKGKTYKIVVDKLVLMPILVHGFRKISVVLKSLASAVSESIAYNTVRP